MTNNISECLVLTLGTRGYAMKEEYEYSPVVAWERIDALLRIVPHWVFILLPWHIRQIKKLARMMDLSAGAVILLTVMVSAGHLAADEIKTTLKWPDRIIKRYLDEILSAGYLMTHRHPDGNAYDLTLNGIFSMLQGVSIQTAGDPYQYLEYRDNAYGRMVNLALSLHGYECVDLPETPKNDSPMPAPVVPDDETTSLEFFDGLAKAVNGYADRQVPLTSIIDTAAQCLQESINETLRNGFDALGFAALSQAEKAFLLLLCHQFRHNGVEPMILSGYGNILGGRSDDVTNLRRAAGALVALGIAAVPTGHTHTGDSDNDSEERYILSPDAAGAIFKGRSECINYASICHQADVIRAEGLQQKTLHFNESMLKDVDTLRTFLNPEKSAELMDRLAKQGRQSLTCLFYGAPGSGKTELTRQLAAETGRDIIIADPAKLAGSYVGDGEKNMREIFRVYKYMVKLSDRAPILLYNEADGILSKRFTAVRQYVEKSENAIQGIILQELEKLQGIFIATTNLERNLDEAMDRRFLFKLHFDVPTADVRAKILRDKMPWMDVQTAEAIARDFTLSGGQVDNVAARCAIEQFTSGTEPYEETVRKLCNEELSLAHRRGYGSRNKIGFAYKGRE